MTKEKMNKKRRKITLFLILAVVGVFFFLGKDNGSLSWNGLNSQLDKALVWVDNRLNLGLVNEKPIFVGSLEDSILQVHVIDVGQGESILLRTTDGDILIDAGETINGSDVVDYLNAQGVARLELLIATHPHSDHIGGMAEVVDNFEIGQLAMPEIPDELVPTSNCFFELLEAADRKGLTIFSIDSESRYSFGETKLEVLSPLEPSPDLNNLSAVIRLDIGELSFLFTGDCEKSSEQKMLDYGSNLQVDVLSLGHHGSNTSTTKEFLSEVSPSVALLSCGIDNSYKHPHREVMERLEVRGVTIYRTDLDGNVVLETNGKELSVSTDKKRG